MYFPLQVLFGFGALDLRRPFFRMQSILYVFVVKGVCKTYVWRDMTWHDMLQRFEKWMAKLSSRIAFIII